MVDMLAGHLPHFGPDLKGFHTNGAVDIHPNMRGFDLHRRHGLDRRFRCRWVVKTTAREAVDLDLGELVKKPLEARPHEKLRHAGRKRAKAGPRSVVVVKLEARRAVRIAATTSVGRAAEDDHGVEGGSISDSEASMTADP